MLEYQFKRTNESTLFFILRPRIFSTNCGSRSIKKLDKDKIGDVFFFLQKLNSRLTSDVQSKWNVCIIRPRRAEEITNAEKKRECT